MTTTASPHTVFPALAAGLCQDSDIGLVFGEAWRFNPRRRFIEVNKDHLEREPDKAAGLLGHEVGHVWISRYHLYKPRGLHRVIWGSLLNAVEDPRVNGWIRRRYPGTEPWFQAMFAADQEPPPSTPSRFLLWGAAAAVADAYRWEETPSWIRHQSQVLDAFERTADARRRYAQETPPPDLVLGLTERALNTAIASEVEPRLIASVYPHRLDGVEKTILLSAARALDVAVGEIIPVVRSLIDADERAIANFLVEQPDLAEALEEGLRSDFPEILTMIDFALQNPAPIESDPGAEIKLARRAFARYLGHKSGAPRGDHGVQADKCDGVEDRLFARRRRPKKEAIDPSKITAAVNRQLPSLLRNLEEVLTPWTRRRLRPGFPTGQRIDLRRAMAFQVDQRGYDRLWCRNIAPAPPRAAVSLLVDLSGSMQGEKIDAAAIGTMLLAETLNRLAPAVRFAINGFQDELIPFLRFGETLSPATRAEILAMVDEAYGTRVGGRNHPQHNDDGPCLAEAAELLGQEPGQRILFVVSDGLPSGRRSDKQDLHDVITRLTHPGQEMALFGLGLGPDTDHVSDFYPNAVANIPVDEFATQVGQLLKRVLLCSGHRQCRGKPT